MTFDSVSRLTGLKYHSPRGDWEKRIQPITDAVCKKFGLPPLTFDEERAGAPYETWRENKARENGEKTDPNKVSWTDIIRDDIDEAVRNSDSYASFLSYLESRHYQVRDGKYLSLKPYGKPKAVRTRSLGPGYGKEELIERIRGVKDLGSARPFVVYGDVQAVRLLMIGKREKNKNFRFFSYKVTMLSRSGVVKIRIEDRRDRLSAFSYGREKHGRGFRGRLNTRKGVTQ